MSRIHSNIDFNHFASQTSYNFFNNKSVAAQTIDSTTFDISTFSVVQGDGSNETHPRQFQNHGGSEFKKLFCYGKCKVISTTDTFGIYVSHNGNDYYLLTEIRPKKPHAASGATDFHFSHMGHLPARYVRFGNLSTNAITDWDLHLGMLN